MYRSPVTTASLLCIVVIAALLSVQSTTAFTISMAPLLTTRLMGFGNNYAKNFSTSATTTPSIDKETRWGDETIANKKKAAIVEPRSAFQFESFELEDVRMISHEKSDLMELVYARSINRIEEFGLATASV